MLTQRLDLLRGLLDTVGSGCWIALSDRCFGHSANVTSINPNTIDILLLKGFTCHSNYDRGLRLGVWLCGL